ncbi:hypothetical protein E1B28_009404 [Marasmius oreades]|uniref:Uncharacterized protein n=1 Tax=Marasmius oreades TaxID=181124 RepID=A0A9P7S0G4_9AGAR|nr:uncharacterized protein E1B28_009404 [Marasmius oreades]KAG7093119.1 hypothetical protein E1B28_009404 [Marasmius oreades]
MFIIATGHIVTSYFMGLHLRTVDSLGTWYNVLSNALYIIQELLGTGVAIYRMWIVWNRNWKVTVIPIFLLLSGIALGCMPFTLHLILPPSELTGRHHLIFTFIAIFSFLIVVLNVICTSLIVYPLFSFHRATSILRKLPKRSSILPPVIRILIESAMLQLVVELLFLVLWLLHHAAQYIVFSLTVPFVVSIVNSSIRSVVNGVSAGYNVHTDNSPN